MPVKRNRKFQNQNKEESQTIRTRLIEISLKLDEFIYQKKPISGSEADMFIREVTSYKTKCSKDERSLQVIEKIVRCMKSIIAELQETRIDHCNTYDEDSYLDVGATSPVYSLEDEDRTQFTQEAIEEHTYTNTEKSNEVLTANIDFNDHDCDRTLFTQSKTVVDSEVTLTEVITISDDDAEDNSISATGNTNTVTRPTLYSDAEMHRALSNLSLKDVSQEEIAYTSAECSQSILNNFHEIDNLEQVKSSNVISDDRKVVNEKTKVNEPIDAKRKLQDRNIKKQNEKLDTIGSRKVIHVIKAPASNIKHPGTNNGKNNTPGDKLPLKTVTCLSNTYNFAKTADKKIETAQNIPYEEKVKTVTTKTINETQLNFTPVTYNANLNQTKNNVDEKITVQGNSNNQNAAIIKKKRAPRKKKVREANDSKIAKKDNNLSEKGNNDMNNIKPAPKRCNTKKKNRVNKDCPIPIYNKNVENDLSWMENIRFVREIQDDEYDRKLSGLDENLWDNYHLPPNFDESDFL